MPHFTTASIITNVVFAKAKLPYSATEKRRVKIGKEINENNSPTP
jgi:hypothetical protein